MSKKPIKSDLARLDRMKDKDIDYSDIPPLDKSFLTKPTVQWPPAKQQVTVRLDTDVLDWLKAYGKGYQTRINRILRAVIGNPAAFPPDARAKKEHPITRRTEARVTCRIGCKSRQ